MVTNGEDRDRDRLLNRELGFEAQLCVRSVSKRWLQSTCTLTHRHNLETQLSPHLLFLIRLGCGLIKTASPTLHFFKQLSDSWPQRMETHRIQGRMDGRWQITTRLLSSLRAFECVFVSVWPPPEEIPSYLRSCKRRHLGVSSYSSCMAIISSLVI